LRETEHLLAALDEAETLWDEFIQTLGRVVAARADDDTPFWNPSGTEALKRVENLRIDLASRQQELFPAYRDPLAKFLRTTVRTFSPALWELLGRFIYDGGQMLLPLGIDDETVYKVDLSRFEINAGEARGEIARRRRELQATHRQQNALLDETQRAYDEEHSRALALERARGGHFWTSFRAKLKRLLWWFVEVPIRNLLWLIALIIVFAAVPSSRQWFTTAWSWVRQHADTVRSR
jgi:hypothetical protein